MNFKKIFYWVLIFIFILVFSLLLFQNNNSQKDFSINNIKYVQVAEQVIKIELALTPETQVEGLSGRSILKEDEGMLFVFDKFELHNFWMKEMNFPIDIIWLNKNFEIVYIQKNAQPESFPETFGPEKETKYVLEVIAGFCEKNNLKVGDRVEFLP